MRKLFFLLLLFGTAQLSAQNLVPLNLEQINGEGNFDEVKPGDTVFIESGDRAELLIKNFHGTAGQPIFFFPSQDTVPVRIRSNLSYGISLRSCSFIRLSGWQGEDDYYGIQILELDHESSVGIGISDKSTDIEIDHIEVGDSGFAGILAKTDPVCGDPETQRGGFIQKNTWIHHCYIHDTGAEGIYAGHFSFSGYDLPDCGLVFPTVLEGVRIYQNIIERSGWDGIQVTSAISDCQIYDNEVIDCSVSQTVGHMSGILIGGGTLADCYNNLIADCYGTGILVFGNGGTRVFNNVILRSAKRYAPDNPDLREHGIYLNDKTNLSKSFYGIFSNTIIQPKSDCIRIAETVDFEVRIFNNILVDPGAWSVYENDNTDWTGNDSFIFIQGERDHIRKAANATVRSMISPRFIDADNDDYHLDISSPYIDAGRDLSDQDGISFDFDYKERPFGFNYDIGAYEYVDVSGIREARNVAAHIQTVFHPSGNGRGYIMLYMEKPETLSWRLVGLDGRIVRQENLIFIDSGEYVINLPYSNPGIYLLQIIAAGWRQSEKLLVY